MMLTGASAASSYVASRTAYSVASAPPTSSDRQIGERDRHNIPADDADNDEPIFVEPEEVTKKAPERQSKAVHVNKFLEDQRLSLLVEGHPLFWLRLQGPAHDQFWHTNLLVHGNKAYCKCCSKNESDFVSSLVVAPKRWQTS
jgi:hypothetical protein